MKFNVTDIEFDFDDDYAEESKLTFDEEIAIRDLALGVWEADNDDDLLDEITTATGWCIKKILHLPLRLVIFQTLQLVCLSTQSPYLSICHRV